MGVNFEIAPPNPPNDGILFVDHSKLGRSGHLGHALIEYEDNIILAFYPNCSDDHNGHSAIGWMEYKRSEDGGQTWSKPYVLDYSKKIFEEGEGRSAMSEKAILTSDGTLVLFNLVCDISETALWEPYLIPTYIRSLDGGHTWIEAKTVSEERGRIYDAFYDKNTIFVLKFLNDATINWTGNKEEHVYCLYVSTDNGEIFSKRSELPFNTRGRGYGTMKLLSDNRIIAYIYNHDDEQHLDYVISDDFGHTWSAVNTAYFEKKIRNPQMAAIDDCYFMHGRSGNLGDGSGNLVLYSSVDGINWDNGIYVRMQEAGTGAYSNNLVVGTFDPEKRKRLLIQSSHAYDRSKTNVLHWWLENIQGPSNGRNK
jgi:hypothetical protein